jgi:2-dehydro-3-deoxygluconokinase
MSDVLGIGEALVELNQPTEGAPFVQGFGGDTSNAVIAAARLGADAAYFTAVGADPFGRALVELWRREGVDASRIVVNSGAHTGIYFVSHGPEGHEFSYMRAGSAASRISESDVPDGRIRAAKVLHVSGISQAISSSAADAVFAAIDIAREAKRFVSYDPNLRLKLWPLRRARAIIHEAMALCDIALPGRDDAEALTGRTDPDGIVDFYLRLGARIVVLKLGKAGALVATTRRRERIDARVVKAVDATGAGDCFDGAFLAEYVRSGDPFAAARFANVAAALSTTGYGAVAPLPVRADVDAALEASA